MHRSGIFRARIQNRGRRGRDLDDGLWRAGRLAGRGRLAAAVRIYLREAAENPSELQLLNRAGDLCARAGRLDRALPLFRRVAEGYAAAGFRAKARAVYRKILRFEPNCADTQGRLAALSPPRSAHGPEPCAPGP